MAKPRKTTHKKNIFAAQPGRGYTPSAFGFGGGGMGSLLSMVTTGKPLFTFLDVPIMLADNHIQYGLNMLIGQFMKAKWKVNSPDPNVQSFVDKTVTKFWRKIAGEVLHRYLPWGAGPAIFEFKVADDGFVTLSGGRAVEPADARPRVFREGTDAGKYAGFDLVGGQNFGSEVQNAYVPAPFGFWFAGNERRGRLYDTSRLAGAYTPWLSKNGRGGGLASREIYFRKSAFNPGVIYHPVGVVDPSDPSSREGQDIAREMAEKIENGATLIFPNTANPGMDGKSNEKAWAYEPSKQANSTVPILEYLDALDQEIMRGILMPPEVLDASETGSGWSGRMIPRDALFGVVDAIKDPLFDAFDQQVLKHLVPHNFGEDAQWELDPVPMDESVKVAEGNNPTSMVGNGQQDDPNPSGMQGGDAQGGNPPQGGGGDQFQLSVEPDGGGGSPTAGGLLPYVGKKGGHGKKNPRTGRVYYMGHDAPEREYGCLLAPITGSLKDACLKLLDSIPTDELVEDGREDDSHITIRYGLHDDDAKGILSAVEPLGSLAFVPGPLALFKKPDCDVLYVSCLNPEQWKKYHDALNHLPHTDTYDSFQPHCTIAYLKPGKGAKYSGKPLEGAVLTKIDAIEYHSPQDHTTSAPVWPSEDELEGLSILDTYRPETDELGWTQGQSRSGNVKAVGYGEHQGRVEYGAEALKVLNVQQPAVGSSSTGRRAVDKQYPTGGIQRRDVRNAGAGYSPEKIAEWAGQRQKEQQAQPQQPPAPKPQPQPQQPAPQPQPTQTQPRSQQPLQQAQQPVVAPQTPANTGTSGGQPQDSTTTEQPVVEPEPVSSGHATSLLHGGLSKSQGLSDEQRAKYTEAVGRATAYMPKTAHELVKKNLSGTTFHPNSDGIAGAMVKHFQENGTDQEKKGAADYFKGKNIAGAYIKSSRQLHLDGDNNDLWAMSTGRHGTGGGGAKSHEIYAHELGHAIDGPDYAVSGSPEWKDVMKDEIKHSGEEGEDYKLSAYAVTSPSEALAEFSRLVYGSDVPHAKIAADFPQATAIFKKRGLWPDKERAGGSETKAKEVFEERIPIGKDGSHADVLKSPREAAIEKNGLKPEPRFRSPKDEPEHDHANRMGMPHKRPDSLTGRHPSSYTAYANAVNHSSRKGSSVEKVIQSYLNSPGNKMSRDEIIGHMRTSRDQWLKQNPGKKAVDDHVLDAKPQPGQRLNSGAQPQPQPQQAGAGGQPPVPPAAPPAAPTPPDEPKGPGQPSSGDPGSNLASAPWVRRQGQMGTADDVQPHEVPEDVTHTIKAMQSAGRTSGMVRGSDGKKYHYGGFKNTVNEEPQTGPHDALRMSLANLYHGGKVPTQKEVQDVLARHKPASGDGGSSKPTPAPAQDVYGREAKPSAGGWPKGTEGWASKPTLPPQSSQPSQPQRFEPPAGWKPKYKVAYTDKNGQRVKKEVEFDPKSGNHQDDVNAMIATIRKDGGKRLVMGSDEQTKQFADQQWKDKYAKSGPEAPKEKPPEAQRLPQGAPTPLPKEHLDWAKQASAKQMPAFLQKAGINERSPHYMKARAAFQSGVMQAMQNLHKSGNSAIKHRVILPNGKSVVLTLKRKMTASLGHGEPVTVYELSF